MPKRMTTRFWHRRGVHIAAVILAASTALVLPPAPGRGQTNAPTIGAGTPPLSVAPPPILGPFPDPGNDLTDPGIPGNPPPPAGGIDASGPGSPNSGVTVSPAGPASFLCVLPPGEQETVCLRPQSGERYTVCPADPKIYSFEIVESAASDGTVLRKTQFAPDGCQVVSFPPNTIVKMVNDSPYQREYFTRSTFASLGQSDDFLCEVRIHDPYEPRGWPIQRNAPGPAETRGSPGSPITATGRSMWPSGTAPVTTAAPRCGRASRS